VSVTHRILEGWQHPPETPADAHAQTVRAALIGDEGSFRACLTAVAGSSQLLRRCGMRGSAINFLSSLAGFRSLSSKQRAVGRKIIEQHTALVSEALKEHRSRRRTTSRLDGEA
jgi:hypothetical protein